MRRLGLAGARTAALAACLALFVLAAASARAADKRVALVIGNAAYVALPELSNSVNDSVKIRETLRDAGFEVFYGADVTRVSLEELIKTFYRAVDGADIALIYYSGHGVQVAGDNFIVPVDAKLATPYDIEQQTIKVGDLYRYLSAHARAQIIFLDACRNNPFRIDRFWIGDTLKVADAKEGLARADYGVGSLIAFSTEPGAVAYDGTGSLSPYTSALARHVAAPNEEIRHALTLVRREVIAATDGKQVPWENSSLVEDVYLMRAPPAPVVQPMARLDVAAGAEAAAVRLPTPIADSVDGLLVKIDQLPDKGRLLLDGAPIAPDESLTLADLERLAFDARGLAPGVIEIMSYQVLDRWRQSARAVAVIAIQPPDAVASAERDRELAHRLAADAAHQWLKGLDGLTRTATVGVGPVGLNLPAPPKLDPMDAPELIVVAAPEAGVLKLGDRSLTADRRVTLAEATLVAFTPAIGEGAAAHVTLALADRPDERVTLTLQPEIDACDREAASPLDLQGVGGGKLPNEIDPEKAVPACQSAAKRFPATPRFLYELGRAELAARRPADAHAAILAAADAKHMRAIWDRGTFESNGAFGAPDLVKANEDFKLCAEAGDAFCLYAYGSNLFYGRGVKRDETRGLDMMLGAAQLGHTFAMNELGFIFTSGRNVAADVERGVRFYEAGAERGDIYSFNNLGLIYLHGAGRPIDYDKARDFFTRAANAGHPYAPTNLGRMARDGVGQPPDIAAALKWLALGAERGDYWGALDRAKLAHEPTEAALYFALAVSFNRPGDNYDNDKQAEKALAKIAAADKMRALASVVAALPPNTVLNGSLDERLVDAQARAWRLRNPRYDLF